MPAFFVSNDERYKRLTGQQCEIVKELDDSERDLWEVGRMFTVRFLCGTEIDAFIDELEGVQ